MSDRRLRPTRVSIAAVALAVGLVATSWASNPPSDATDGQLVIADQGSFAADGCMTAAPDTFDPRRPTDPAGQTYHGDHAYAYYQSPPTGVSCQS